MNGFCMQQTTFPFVAIIVDDASTDGEPDVIRNYLNSHFNMEQADCWETDDAHFIYARHLNNENCYFVVILLKYNFLQIKKDKAPLYAKYEEDVKYIALCEGDDFWCAKDKLQMQVGYMEVDSKCGMVYTNIRQYLQEEGIYKDGWCKQSTFEEMLYNNKVCTASTCYSKELYQQYLNEIQPAEKKWLMGDYPLWLFFFANSTPYFISDVMATYRVLKNSASHFTSFKKRERFILSTYDILAFFAKKYSHSEMLPIIARRRVECLINESDIYRESTSFIFLSVFLKYKIKDFKLYLNAVSTHCRFLRKIYLFVK